MEIEQEEEIQRVTLIAPIYSAKHIRMGTFFGGPLIAGYLIAENYKVFGDYGKAKTAWLYCILATVVIYSGALLIPDSVHFPNYLIPLVYCWLAYYIVQRFQGDEINAYAKTGKAFFGWGRVVLVSLIGLAVTCVFILIIAMATNKLV
jgi:hypothetical protein